MQSQELAMRQAVIDTCLKMNALGINQGTSGNVSLRWGEGFLITPSGVAYEAMEPGQVVRMDLEGGYFGEWLPSTEWRMHLDIYKARAEAGAVVHTHSPFATAMSCLRREIPAFHYMIAVAGGASIRCADYATFGTKALSEAMLAALERRSACLLGTHGQIAFGPTLDKALWLAGEVEALCQQYAIACQVGAPVLLDKAEIDAVLARFGSYGRQAGEMGGTDAMAADRPVRRDG